MSNYDFSRQLDLHKLNYKLRDPNTPEADRKKIENAIYAIKDQAKYKSIAKLREKMTTAIRNTDRDYADKLAEESKKIDRNYT